MLLQFFIILVCYAVCSTGEHLVYFNIISLFYINNERKLFFLQHFLFFIFPFFLSYLLLFSFEGNTNGCLKSKLFYYTKMFSPNNFDSNFKLIAFTFDVKKLIKLSTESLKIYFFIGIFLKLSLCKASRIFTIFPFLF